jgi:hypothetical protein
VIAYGSYFYRVPQVIIGNTVIVNPMYEETENIPNWLYDVDYFTFIFIIAFVLILLMTIYYNTNKNRDERIDKQSVETFLNKIFMFLYPIEEYTDKQKKNLFKDVKGLIRSNHLKMLFINTLRKVYSQTAGPVREKSGYMMKELKFESFIRAYLYSPFFTDKLFALKVIADFQLEGFEKHILKLTKRKNEILHTEAIITLLKLKIYDNLLFLVEMKLMLTAWDVNLIIKTVQELKIVDIDYYTLINSEIPEISALGIMLARLHNRIEFKSDIKHKIGNANGLVNEEASFAFSYFANNQNDYSYLINNFNIATKKSQLNFITKIATIPDKESAINFLDWVVENQPFSQKIVAIGLLLDLDLSIISKYKQSENNIIRESYYQVLDINI